MQTFINSISAKLPWASTSLEPKLDAFGQEVRRGNAENWLENAFNQFINPSDTTHQTYSNDAAVREMMRIFKETDDTKALPGIVTSTEENPLTAQEITEEQKRVGEASKIALEQLISSDKRIEINESYVNAYGKEEQRSYYKYWDEMTDKEKAKVLARIFADAKENPDEYLNEVIKG